MAKPSVEAQRAADRKRAGKRSRNWAIVFYPDSAPDNWREIISDLQIKALVSPLHSDDKNPGGDLKKPHYHLLMMFDSVKCREQIQEISESLNAPIPKQMDSAVGTARYLCHLDNPEKQQYDPSEVIEFGGVDYRSLINRTSDKYRLISEMMDWCDEQGIYSFAALMRFSRKENDEWFRALCDNAGWAMKEYMKSAQWEIDVDDKLQNQKARQKQYEED